MLIDATALWMVICAVIAVVGSISLYFMYVSPGVKTKNKYLNYIIDFCNFKKIIIESLIKIAYMACAIFITLYSFNFFGNPLSFFMVLIIGNIIVRISYEVCIILLMIWKNTTQINKKLK